MNRYTVSIFLCYRDILGIGRPTDLGCISHTRVSGASPEFTEIIPEIVNLGDHLGRSGYCPVPIGCLTVADGVVGGCFYLVA